MSQHEELFKQQGLARSRASEEKSAGHPLVEFDSSFGRCATRIEHVREVIATPAIIPYPETHDGHLGVVNVRGQIIPVVGRSAQLAPASSGGENAEVGRLVIFEFSLGRSFAVPVERVRKVVCEAELAPGRVLNLGGAPARFVDHESFFFERGGAA